MSDTVNVPNLLVELFDLSKDEAREVFERGGVKVKRDGHEIPLKDQDVSRDKLAGQTITLGSDREAQVPE